MTNFVPAPPTDPPKALDGSMFNYLLHRLSIYTSFESTMDSDKYLEEQSMQRPPLFESDHFYLLETNKIETYVKAKDLDLWHIILNGDFPPLAKNEFTQVLEKRNRKKVLCVKRLKIFGNRLVKFTHQGNSTIKVNKIGLLVQQYEQFSIFEEESIDSGFARFNTIITSLKALDEGFSSKNYVRKFLRALHPKWRVIGKKERIKSIDLKAKKESSDDETLTSRSDDKEYAMAVRNFKKFFRRKGKFVRKDNQEKKRKSFRQ
ncbi:hypothetical protein Tco_1506037 [Tanacetum coccineum]